MVPVRVVQLETKRRCRFDSFQSHCLLVSTGGNEFVVTFWLDYRPKMPSRIAEQSRLGKLMQAEGVLHFTL